MSLRTVHATRYVTPLREGGSMPAVVEGDDLGLYVLKFRGAGQGVKALIAELVAGELARALEQAAAMEGVRQVTLCVNAGSEGAVRLYESLGFERFGLEPDALYVAPHFYDKLDMVLRLPASAR